MTKTTKKQQGKSGSKKSGATKQAQQHEMPEYEETRREAMALEQAGKWGEAAIAWLLVADIATTAKQKKEAAGRAAAAKVRAQGDENTAPDAGNQTTGESMPLEEVLATSDSGAANAASWDAAMPEPGYVPPAGTGGVGADVDDEDEGADNAATDDGDAATGDGDAATDTGTGARDSADEANGDATTEGGQAADPKASTPAATSDARMPPIGTTIQKLDRHGKVRSECQVVEGGILYAGNTYKSLSAAGLASSRALGLTTKTVDGWTWWGLKTKGTPRATKAAKGLDLDMIGRAWDRYRERAEAATKVASDEEKAKLHALLNGHTSALTDLAAAVA